jgi:Na+-driven multidrug efflux pump
MMVFLKNKLPSDLIQLTKLALPVIATSFMTMAFNFINIIFVGRLGSDAVAAVGSAGFYMNLSWGISSIVTVGAGIKVSHAMGAKNPLLAKSYVRSGIMASMFLSFGYLLIIALTRNFLIGFIGIHNSTIEQSASDYLLLAGLSIPFSEKLMDILGYSLPL